jgi:hypothetical protein
VDLGAAWLHGNSMSNPLLRLSKLCGAELVEPLRRLAMEKSMINNSKMGV